MENNSNNGGKCPFSGGNQSQNSSGNGPKNRDWWPNQLKINIAEKKDRLASVTYQELYDFFINLTNKESVLVNFSDATSIYAEYFYRKKEYENAFSLLDHAEKILIPFSDKKALIDLYSFYSYFWRELKKYEKAHFLFPFPTCFHSTVGPSATTNQLPICHP